MNDFIAYAGVAILVIAFTLWAFVIAFRVIKEDRGTSKV